MIAGDTIPLIDHSFDGKALKLDGEGIAYADGFFYVMGSHGYPLRVVILLTMNRFRS